MIFNFRNKTILGYPKNETQNQQLGANGVIIKENYHEIYTKKSLVNIKASWNPWQYGSQGDQQNIYTL